MPVFVNVPAYITIAKVSQYLADVDLSNNKAFKGGSLDEKLPMMIYMVRKAVEWAYSQNTNDPTLNATALYLYNLCGRYVPAATLIINGGGCVTPTILTNPQSQTINVGDTVNFSVTAAGSTPFTYQWLKNGVAIIGATSNVYSIINAQTTDAGAYSVTVQNACGMSTSLSATLTVNVGIVGSVYYTSGPDPYILLSVGTDNLTYQFTFPIVHNQPLNITLPSAAALNQYLVIRVPTTESVKANWVNTVFNFGTVPDSVFIAYFTIGSFGYYVSRGQVTMDTTTSPNLIFS